MKSKILVTEDELLDFIGPDNWHVLIFSIRSDSNNEYNFIRLVVEIGCQYGIFDNSNLFTAVVSLESYSNQQIIDLINKLKDKSIKSWTEMIINRSVDTIEHLKYHLK